MKKKDIEDNQIVASIMEWDDLASIIIDLEIELYSLYEYLTNKEINHYEKLISIYVLEKDKRIGTLAY